MFSICDMSFYTKIKALDKCISVFLISSAFTVLSEMPNLPSWNTLIEIKHTDWIYIKQITSQPHCMLSRLDGEHAYYLCNDFNHLVGEKFKNFQE